MHTMMNIILIGFKSCGKSTVGALLATLARKSFTDTDSLIERMFMERHKKSLTCREIYACCGEAALRELESEALRRAAEMGNSVIATGGGVVLREDNIPLLHAAGFRVFLDVPLPVLEQRLACHASSPLFAKTSIAAVHRERHPLYLTAMDMRYIPSEHENAEDIARNIHDRVIKENYGQ